VVQIMQTFNLSFTEAEDASQSILATIANPIAYLLVPIVGVASWQLAAAAVTGFIAKENVVGTLAVCFVGLENLIDTEELAMMEGAGAEVAGIIALTKVAALAYLMFNLFTPPCFAALGAMNSEIKDRKWFWGGIALQFATGYVVSYLVYTVGTLITAPASLNITAALIGLLVVIGIGIVIAGLIRKANKSMAREYALSGR
jgi:ferrous iron transport protein B